MVWRAVGSGVRVGFVVRGLAGVVVTGDWLVGGTDSATSLVLTATVAAAAVVVVIRGSVLTVLTGGWRVVAVVTGTEGWREAAGVSTAV